MITLTYGYGVALAAFAGVLAAPIYQVAPNMGANLIIVTGEVKGVIVDGDRKAQLLRQLAQEQGIDMQQVIAVGDGANDLTMMSAANLGVAFEAKPVVLQQAKTSINFSGLDCLLHWLA